MAGRTCKGVCKKYKSDNQRHYGEKNKRCNICEIMTEYEGSRCPCCGEILRRRPRQRSNSTAERLELIDIHRY